MLLVIEGASLHLQVLALLRAVKGCRVTSESTQSMRVIISEEALQLFERAALFIHNHMI